MIRIRLEITTDFGTLNVKIINSEMKVAECKSQVNTNNQYTLGETFMITNLT